jgi:signal transduction histidine kinase
MLRHDISSLMQASLDRQDVTPSLRNLLENFKASEPTILLTSTIDALDVLPPVLAEPLLRFVQETLNNVRKHAQATEVCVSIHLSSTQLTAEVCDNGIGMLYQYR